LQEDRVYIFQAKAMYVC